ncbi:somatostatin receptor type 5 [Anguilla anguilla]|uniref:somatostatin receptor type 5 n=1 Tax=Anguilla anguilla TaxID=7936 RepID=UPI0015AA3271|nr:somatostatin receptor type 5 [Anguilla anguilla]
MASPFAPEGLYNTGIAADPTVGFADEDESSEAGVSGFRVVMAALYLVVCVVGLGGNGLVMAATLKLDRLGSAATVYIFNLALADGLFMAGLPFVAVQNFRSSWPFGEAACKAVMALDGVNQFTSVFCLTAMSVDRCLALGPGAGRWAGWRTPRRAKAVAACLWLLSLAPVLPMALRFSAASGLCTVEPPPAATAAAAEAWWVVFLAYTFVLGFALPFAVMTVAYGALLAALRRRRRGCRGDGGGWVRSPESQRQEQQVTRMVVAVVLAFAVCWLPFYVLNFCALTRVADAPAAALTFARGFEFVVLFSYSWSCANPILYACLSETFRAHFRALLCPKTLPPPEGCHDGDVVTEGYDLRDSTDGRSEV